MEEYRDTPEELSGLIEERFESAKRYLARCADEAEELRLAEWAVPDNIGPDEYAAYMRPFRERVKRMIGYPPPGETAHAPVHAEELGADDDGTFYRVHVPLLEELDACGLLLRPRSGPGRLAVAIHGGSGLPELVGGTLDTGNYNNMGRRLARLGYTVWMPSCFERESLGAGAMPSGDVHRYLDERARMVGTTLTAIDLFCIIKSTEALLDAEGLAGIRPVVAGLSYGGFRALLACALSDTFCACISSCYFNDRRAVLERSAKEKSMPDWFFPNILGTAADVELCRLICPRPLFIEVGKGDTVFTVDGAAKSAREVSELYQRLGVPERFGFEAFEGGHEFSGTTALEFIRKIG